MNQSSLVECQKIGPVALVCLNKPDSLNALSGEMIGRIIEVFDALKRDDAVRAIVLTGNGKAFCAGLDLKELAGPGSAGLGKSAGPDTNTGLIASISQARKPVIAAVNGFAITGGFELALACDFIVCDRRAQFGDTHAMVGVVPGWGLSQKLPRLIGINRAKEMSFTGRFIDAEQALAYGLVNHVYANDELRDKAIGLATDMAAAHQTTLRQVRDLMDIGWGMTLSDGLALESQMSGAINGALDLANMDDRLAKLKQRARARSD